MRDRIFNPLGQRDQGSYADFFESPSAVLAVLAVSALVGAAILVLVVTRIAPIARLSALDEMPAPVSVAELSLGNLPIPDTDPGAPATGFDAPARLVPGTRPQMRPEAGYVPVTPVTPVTPPATVPEPAPVIIAGRPPVDAVPRPASIVELAASLRRSTDPATIAATRPTLRPVRAIAEAPDATVAPVPATIVTTSLRPAARPASLEVAPHDLEVAPHDVAVARAPEPTADVTLAALPTPSASIAPAFDRNANACTRRLAREIPRRPGNAADGNAFITTLASASGTSRDAAIAREVLRGNVPAFLRDLAPVSFTGVLPNGRSAQITICVTPDYLAVGSDRDFVRVPLGLAAAGQIADRFNMMLPTTRMVDAIYAQADLRLTPAPMTPGSQMSSTDYFLRHNATVETQRINAGGRLGMLVAGQKKDVVLTNRLARAPGRVAIYGWQRRGGSPIQPLSTVHAASYADYSHGIRLVSRTAFVNGEPFDLEDLLMSGTYAGLLNSDGPIGRPAIQLASR
jgi:hypothetical protein